MGDFVPKFERDMEMRSASGARMLPTAAAIPVRNEKGEITMQKVKVTRYVAGRAPAFTTQGSESSSDESDDEEKLACRKQNDSKRQERNSDDRESERIPEKHYSEDRRFRRLQRIKQERSEDRNDDRSARRRHVREPKIVAKNTAEEAESSSDGENKQRQLKHENEQSEKEEEETSDQENFERRRNLLRQKATQRHEEEEELLVKKQEDDENEESVSSEEESDSDYETAPRLKPVFVRKRDRITLKETEKEEQRLRDLKLEEYKQMEERKRQSAKLAEDAVKREMEMEKRQKEDNIDLTSVNTDEENEEIAYETWKVREMKRIKRTRDEREALAKEKAELDRVHNMTEEERKAYLRANPKIITNKQDKGKYKFLQKYFHRGAFFLDEDDEVYKRNFAEATLEDRFDKSILPRVMQVKDFGKAGRTKWTHLTAEDTTDHQGAWASETALNAKFSLKHAAGSRDVFDRPHAKKRKT